ncbi:MAG TPA: hypothetical protein VHW44_06260 [Pseudonocardiaceae bacterium]|jgi:hypothetical protein|nr:hypothetical protein [Pseudonocardiaceae bacterium]
MTEDRTALAGWWVAADGKAVLLEQVAGRTVVTVAPARDAEPYVSAELLRGGRKRIHRLPAADGRDRDHHRFLEVEAGTPTVGPTYRLLPGVMTSGGWQALSDERPSSEIVLLPEVGLGLYDDWDDDLGVPWAFPLIPLRWAGAAAH